MNDHIVGNTTYDSSRNTLIENIRKYKEKINASSAVGEYLYSEMASLFLRCRHKIDPDEVRGFYSEISSGESLISDGFARFCRSIADNVALDLFSLNDDEAEFSADGAARISYLKNPYSGKAYSEFSKKIVKASAAYFSSFREVCEEVFYNRSKYAILPIYSSADGPLSSFRKLILKYDLKIVGTVNIDTDEDSYTRFALIQKGLTPLSNERTYLVFYLLLPQDGDLSELIFAISSMGINIKVINTRSAEYYDAQACFDFEIEADGAKINAMILFFECIKARYNIIGKIII